MRENTGLVLEGLNENKGKIEAKKLSREAGKSMENTPPKAGVIGVGAGGSNVAHLLTQYGYMTAALNTTVVDMKNIEVNAKLTLPGLNGSGKDREFAKAEFKKSYKNCFSHDQILELIDNNELIFVIGTAGGGTGTILSIMVAGYIKQEFPNKTVVIVGMLGSLQEDRISQENMQGFLSDLEHKVPECPFMLFDNNRVKDKVGDGVYDTVNREVADAIRFLSKEYFVENSRSNIDGRDYARLMSFGGLMSVTLIDNLNLSVTETSIDLTSRVKDAMAKSTAVITQLPDAYGFYMNVDTEVYNAVDTTFDAVQNMKGKPNAGLAFRHLQDASGSGPQFGVIMTGLESPIERFTTIQKRIDEYSKVKQKATIPEVGRSESVKLAGDTRKGETGHGSGFLDNF